MNTLVRQTVSAILCSVAAIAAAPSYAQSSGSRAPMELNIPAQSLEDSLLELARQASVQLVISSGSLTQRSAPSITGTLRLNEALDRLLRNTDLGYKWTGEKTLMIAPKIAGMQTISMTTAGELAPTRFAQVDDAQDEVPSAATADSASPVRLEEVIVTGSHIRGARPAGVHVQVHDAEAIERSSFTTVQDFIHSLPQNYQGGGGSEDYSPGELATSNWFSASTINLRGLGADSTLVLVNGRRLPASGEMGNYTDISLIPQSAIERIEVLPDGASALYGSDAVGGVVNFVLRKDFEGAETRLRYGTATRGDMTEQRLSQSFGTHWTGGHALVSYEFHHRDLLTYADRPFATSSNHSSRGGTDWRDSYASPGNIFDPMTFLPAYAIPSNQDGRSLSVDDLLAGQVNLRDRDPATSLWPEQDRHSVFTAIEQSISDSVTLFGEASFSDRKMTRLMEATGTVLTVPSTNPFYVNPFGDGPVYVGYSFADILGPTAYEGRVRGGAVATGVRVDFGRWQWQTSASYGRQNSDRWSQELDYSAIAVALADSNPSTSLNLFGHGAGNDPATLAGLSIFSGGRSRSDLTYVSSVLDGPLAAFAGRTVSLAIGADYREDKFQSARKYGADKRGDERHSRGISAAFAELQVPLVLPSDGIPMLRSVDVSIAGRLDDYEDVGSTFNPKFGVSLSPLEGLTLNTSYGTSFRAPNLIERSREGDLIYAFWVADPAVESGATLALVQFGNHPDLASEESRTWTAGFVLEPTSLPGLTFTANYFDTLFENKIDRPVHYSLMLRDERLFPALITRNPSAAQIDALCSQPFYMDSADQCTPSLIGVMLDWRLQNMASSAVQGFDFSATYARALGDFNLSVGASGAYMLKYAYQQTASSPEFDTVDTIGNPTDFRGNLSASLARGGVSGTVNVHYTDSYGNDESMLRSRVGSFTTVNLNLAYRFGRSLRPEVSGRYSLNLHVENLFDRDPPFADTYYGYDPDNADPKGRMLSLELKANW